MLDSVSDVGKWVGFAAGLCINAAEVVDDSDRIVLFGEAEDRDPHSELLVGVRTFELNKLVNFFS